MPIIAALVGIILGAIAAIAYMRTAKQGSLHEADEKIQSAHILTLGTENGCHSDFFS